MVRTAIVTGEGKMTMRGNVKRVLLTTSISTVVAVTLGLSGGTAFGQANAAFDGASNYAPSSWSSTPANLGTGFGAWDIIIQNNNMPPYAGTYLDTSSAVASNGYSWGNYANSPQGSTLPSVDFVRPFTGPGGAALSSGETFSINLSADGVGNGTGAAQGFSLETAPGSPGIGSAELTFAYFGSTTNNNMELDDNGGTTNASTGIAFANLNTGLHVVVAEGNAGAYTITVTPVGGGAPLFTASGTTVGQMNQVDVFDDNTSGNGYFNNLAITVPEPSSIALVGIGLLGAIGMIRRRKV
jgi:hypothetical protein